MTLHVLNDLHLAAVRSSGTTPATAYQLRQDLLAGYARMLDEIDDDLALNGDVFDGADVSKKDLLQAFQLTASWLTRTGKRLYAVTGNHDISRNTTNFSAFQFFAALLVEQFPEQVVHVTEGIAVPEHDAYVVPHVANQSLFDLELAKVPQCRLLLVHCNYDNQFAAQQDHSLNLSKEQAEKLPVEYIIFGHEHQARTELGGKVVIVGNQQCSSVSDCLNNTVKHRLAIPSSGPLQFHATWQAEGDFVEVDWREIADHGARFIRVTGTASAEEANKVVNAIGRLRRESSALVITNAVKVAGVADGAELQLTHEEVTNFNVMAALLEFLGPEDGAELTKVMEEEGT